ncbi:MAG: (2Fe-2S)-binding protein [Cytophagaceae bacterium]|jgi:predicted molibdopterin-dependent oxidoreductase YjgC|nr:(2Fe-2S)-binding protein [Cytophagaceae bacterium]
MTVTINNIPTEALGGETVFEVARRAGFDIPSLCYAKGAAHKSSCMVCAVKNTSSGQIIPSCTTLPAEGMQIETDSEEIQLVRRLSLELLLSDHRADCDAPCTMVCPKGLDVERFLWHYDAGRYDKAHQLLCAAFNIRAIGCDDCKAPCEKACRRGTVDQAVQIRTIIKGVAAMFEPSTATNAALSKPDKSKFQSMLGRFSDEEKKRLAGTAPTASRCLHCACDGKNKCKLRTYAAQAGIKKPRYNASSATQAMKRQHIKDDIWFEQSKCIRCGLCVYNSQNGFTFMNRGFGMQVILPDENHANVTGELAELCPVGALYRAPY